jgi:hypothetical protein
MSPQRRDVQLPAIGPDIDLDTEEIYLADGRRLTNELAEEIAQDALAHHRQVRGRGRPSITGGQERTPNLTVRVTPSTRAALEQIAAAQGRRLADVGRDALDEYIRRHSGKSSGTKGSPSTTGKTARQRVKAAP